MEGPDLHYVEWVAAALGIVNVALVVARSVWNYPFGLLMVMLYAVVFYDARLYSDAFLQVFFFGIQIYGWINWQRTRDATGEVRIERLTGRDRIAWLGATISATFAWGALMAFTTNAVAPWQDAGIAITSVAAQFLLSMRKMESWYLWIAVDVAAIGLFWSRDLRVTAILYAVFLVLAVAGLINWRRLSVAAPAR